MSNRSEPVASQAMDRDGTATSELEARLDALEVESKARREELKALAAALPEATSRRAYLSAMAKGIAAAPDKPTVVRRVVAKAFRAPVDLLRRDR